MNLDNITLSDNGMMISWMDTDEDVVGTFEILVSKDTDRVHSESSAEPLC